MRTRIASTTRDSIEVRGHDVARDLMGKVDFTEMMLLTSLGRLPTPAERRIVDAIAVSVMDHGLTPSSLAARLTLLGAPESFQAAVAAGLLGAGRTFLGGMTEVTVTLRQGAVGLPPAATDDDVLSAAGAIVAAHKTAGSRIAGLGHNVHPGGDPRVPRMRQLVLDEGFYDVHWRLLEMLPVALEQATGRRLPVNNVGAIGASVAALGFPVEMGRGIALAARAAGLIAHLLEEQESPLAKDAWEQVLATEWDDEGR